MAKKSLTQIIRDRFPDIDPGAVIAGAVQRNNGSLPAAARELGISHSGLWRYLNTSRPRMPAPVAPCIQKAAEKESGE
jgi:hypothetical protein